MFLRTRTFVVLLFKPLTDANNQKSQRACILEIPHFGLRTFETYVPDGHGAQMVQATEKQEPDNKVARIRNSHI